MPYAFPPDVAQLVAGFMATGRFASHDELLLEALKSIQQEEDDWTAISESLKDMEAGDTGLPLSEAFSEIRQELGLGSRK